MKKKSHNFIDARNAFSYTLGCKKNEEYKSWFLSNNYNKVIIGGAIVSNVMSALKFELFLVFVS